jgi:catechol 2,3-dioxygenase-like lactoylglutathione lyase family enzyme
MSRPERLETAEESVVIKIQDVAYVRFAAPDLDEMERFATDFGLLVSAREPEVVYARGSDPEPFIHVTERGEPAFLGLGFDAESAADLKVLADAEGVPIEAIDGPGGGEYVRLTDPNGLAIDVVHGRKALEASVHPTTGPINRGSDRQRLGRRQHVNTGPPRVKRLGHAGILTPDFETTLRWYQSHFGLLISDEIYLGDESNVLGAFMRCDRGSEFSDHHAFVCFAPPGGGTGLDHVSFEVEDFDAVMVGHDHLAKAGYEHKMGVGRHILGSQVYDYWKDPWGHVYEHFTDGDLLDASEPAGKHDPGVALGTHWGVMAP